MDKEILTEQILITKENLKPEAEMHKALIEFTNLIEMFFEYIEEKEKKI